MNKKLTIEDEKLFLDKDVYKTSSKESDVVSCFFSKDKQCKIGIYSIIENIGIYII